MSNTTKLLLVTLPPIVMTAATVLTINSYSGTTGNTIFYVILMNVFYFGLVSFVVALVEWSKNAK